LPFGAGFGGDIKKMEKQAGNSHNFENFLPAFNHV
jgi:hypothetical protein